VKDYPLPKCVSIKFRGSLEGLVEKLDEKFDNIYPKSSFDIGGLYRGPDFYTKVHCSTPGAPVRRVLTDCPPLSHYNRFLWIAVTRPLSDYNRILWADRIKDPKGRSGTSIDYLGSTTDGKLELTPLPNEEVWREGGQRDDVDYDSGAPKVNGVIPFDYGEIAYRNNPDPDKEKVRVNLVKQAIIFIDERLKADKPLQVRWAMFYLGKRKAKEGVPVLLKYLDYRYTTCGILEESYPAVRALTQIGKPAADAAFDELVGKEQSDLRVRLLTAVVRAVDGLRPARDRLEKALAGAECDAQKKRLQLALKWLQDEKE
jgi:hypothetical protein